MASPWSIAPRFPPWLGRGAVAVPIGRGGWGVGDLDGPVVSAALTFMVRGNAPEHGT